MGSTDRLGLICDEWVQKDLRIKVLFKTYSLDVDKEESFRNYLVYSWLRVAWGVKRFGKCYNIS